MTPCRTKRDCAAWFVVWGGCAFVLLAPTPWRCAAAPVLGFWAIRRHTSKIVNKAELVVRMVCSGPHMGLLAFARRSTNGQVCALVASTLLGYACNTCTAWKGPGFTALPDSRHSVTCTVRCCELGKLPPGRIDSHISRTGYGAVCKSEYGGVARVLVVALQTL